MNALMTLLLAGIAAAAPAATKEDAGKTLFAAKCASCHAKDGKGSAPMAKMFKVEKSALDLTSEKFQAGTDADALKIISDGKGKMPAFKGKIKEGELSGLLGYTRSLAPAKKEEAQAKPAAAAEPEKK